MRRDAKLTFDPVTKDLIQIDMPLGRERYQLKLDAGWVTPADPAADHQALGA